MTAPSPPVGVQEIASVRGNSDDDPVTRSFEIFNLDGWVGVGIGLVDV